MNQLFNARRSPLMTGITGLGRWLALGVVTLALWVGLGVLSARYAPTAMAANTAEAPEHGPIRQTHNPISKENFQGGVDRTALERSGRSSQPQTGPQTGLQTDSETGPIERLKHLVPGLSADESPADSPQSNIQPEPNPTLKRYGGQQ
ncbi:MAG: hypothetical protein ACFCVD_20565 [Nodosilinea sp.]